MQPSSNLRQLLLRWQNLQISSSSQLRQAVQLNQQPITRTIFRWHYTHVWIIQFALKTCQQVNKPRLKTLSNDKKNLNSLGIQIDSKQNIMSMIPECLIEMSSWEGSWCTQQIIKEEKEAWVVLFCGQRHSSTKELLAITPRAPKRGFPMLLNCTISSPYSTIPRCLKISNIVEPIFAGDSTTVTPASLSALILSWAVPFPPDTMAA